MLPTAFERATPGSDRSQNHSLDGADIGINHSIFYIILITYKIIILTGHVY